MARGKGKEFQEWIRLWQQHALFLAALAALGLPWSHTYSLTNCFVIVLDSKPSSLPDQIETLQNWWGDAQLHMEVDQVAGMMMDIEVDKVADMVMKILLRTK